MLRIIDTRKLNVYTHRCVQGKEKEKMKRKNSKKSGIIAAVVGLSAVSLVSVGFASWIISAGDSATIEGTIQVDTVEDHRFNILNKSALQSQNCNVVFGHPSAMEAENEWLKANGTKVENLEFSFDVYVENMNATVGSVSATLDYAGTGSTYTANKNAYEAQDDTHGHKVIADLPTPTYSEKTQNTDSESAYHNKWYVTVTIKFGWGSYFTLDDEPVNPYLFYNDGTKTAADNGDDAVQKLGYVALAGNVNYKLTITTAEA